MREILLGFDARERDTRLPDIYRTVYLLRDNAEHVLSAPDWIGPNTPFWEDLESLERHITGAYTLIAATWHAEADEPAVVVGPYENPTNPAVRDAAWTLLGYDVADPGISGVSNCGYTADELRDLPPIWARRLNDHHLFVNIDHAFEFRALANKRVPEHAPFFVIGLWLIREVK